MSRQVAGLHQDQLLGGPRDDQRSHRGARGHAAGEPREVCPEGMRHGEDPGPPAEGLAEALLGMEPGRLGRGRRLWGQRV